MGTLQHCMYWRHLGVCSSGMSIPALKSLHGLSLCPSNEDLALSGIRKSQHLFSHLVALSLFRLCEHSRASGAEVAKKPFSPAYIGQIREYVGKCVA